MNMLPATVTNCGDGGPRLIELTRSEMRVLAWTNGTITNTNIQVIPKNFIEAINDPQKISCLVDEVF